MLTVTGSSTEAVALLQTSIDDLGPSDRELILELECGICACSKFDATTAPMVRQRLDALDDRHELSGATPAERMLLGERAIQRAFEVAPAQEVAALAERALAGPWEITRLPEANLVGQAVYVLSCADRLDFAWRITRDVIRRARGSGSTWVLCPAFGWSAHIAFRQGRLREAEASAVTGVEASRLMGWWVGHAADAGWLVDALIERGDLDGAQAAVDDATPGDDIPAGLTFDVLLESRARLRLAQGRAQEGLADLFEFARREAHGRAGNPACSPWRSEAAVTLAGLGDMTEARRLAEEEVVLARRFGAARAIGVALRALGLVEKGEDGVSRLLEAVSILARSPARLEQARALTDLGAALRRRRRSAEARAPLQLAVELARRCGATVLAQRAHDELVSAGARPRRLHFSGVDALTAREHRVAELAADGLTNNEIAQALFVTRKTVESHLGHIYRKLDIGSRSELAAALGAEPSPVTGSLDDH